jgi:hypothetical protein
MQLNSNSREITNTNNEDTKFGSEVWTIISKSLIGEQQQPAMKNWSL